ncbi:zinc-ribbon domain-containing protein [Lactobacillus sp. Sy-1]|uniref:zinc-ribbon domain-containing protein n=1 Tax=Lactobacillus sp. Sy-1 TaxID=2109645 RepID=UPI001C5A315B|nr:zinc ribbon domain-containing protein [Lactobacillus sp. Sy-1]MBW1605025.1 zinc-ribbon domain-containing protein [Lactobacillus sp. Sy-1]
MKFCPNCGTKVTDNTEFCPNCGYQFKDVADQPQPNHIYDSAERNDAGANSNVNDQSQMRTQPKKKANKLVISLVAIIVLLLAVGGFAAYKLVLTPGNQQSAKSSSSSSSASTSSASSSSAASVSSASNSQSSASNTTISANDANDVLSGVFSSAADDISGDGDASDIASNFVGGTGNSGYQQLASWVKGQNGSDSISSVTMNVQNLTTRGNDVNFQVKYDFSHTNGERDHIQVFDWHGKMENDNGQLMIQTLTGSHTAASDYYE